MYFSKYDKIMKILKFNFILFFILLLTNCATYKTEKTSKIIEKKFYSSSGFALVYDENLFKDGLINKKLQNDKIIVMHSYLKKNTLISILNPVNSKILLTKVHKQVNHPGIFNVVISKKLADYLELDLNNPYIEILEIKKNKTFVAKKGITYDEEKNVATKAPVEKIEVANLSDNGNIKLKTQNKKDFYLVISDFYYLSSAKSLQDQLNSKITSGKLLVKKIANNQYRLYAGPFKNFNTLKSTYISLNKLGFDDLNIIKK